MDIEKEYETSFDLELESVENLKNIIHSESEIEEISKRFNNGTETIDDLINNYRHLTIRFELKNGIEQDLEVVELKYYLKLVEKVKALLNELDNKDKIINAIAEMLVKDHEWFYSEFDNYTKQDFIDYFTKKVTEEENK